MDLVLCLMITNVLLLELLLTFLAGSCWIYLTVLAGLRFGSKTGGFIGGLPSTALLAFFFIGFTQSPEIAAKATTTFPIAISFSGLFLVVFATLARKGFMLALLSGLGFWFLLSAAFLLFRVEIFMVNLIIYAVVMLFAFLMLEKYLMVRSVFQNKSKPSEKQLALRSVYGGAIVTLIVIIERTAGPVVGGLFAGFPAMFISTLAVSYKAHGIEFSRAMTKPLMVTGMITIAVFAIGLRYLLPATGLYFGTLLSLGLSAVSAYLTFRFILSKLK
jgi:hypothetical protein